MRGAQILILLLACIVAIPAAADARKRTIPPTAVEGNVLIYQVKLGSRAEVRNAWLKGPSDARRLRLAAVRRSLARHRVRVHISRAVRQRLGGRPRLVLEVTTPFSVDGGRSGDGTTTGGHADGGPVPSSTAGKVTVGISPSAPVGSDPIPDECNRFASPGGSDSADGSRQAPFATAQKLADALGPGDVGCLDAGTYHQATLAIQSSGTPAQRVVLRSTPGQRALIEGQIWIADSANFVTVAYVDNDATTTGLSAPRPSPVVNGDDALFYGIDVWSRNSVCFYLGDSEWGVAYRTVIRHNHIHDCGESGTNHRHGIYMADAVDTVIEENAIYDNPDRGIQLYPYSQGAIIRHNVIDSNGEGIIISGDHGYASNGNLIEGNVISNSRLRHDVESWWPIGNPIGDDNVVRGNCIGGGSLGAIEEPQVGFTADDNILIVPTFSDPANRSFGLPTNSPCAAVMNGVQVG